MVGGQDRRLCWVAGRSFPCWLPALGGTAYKVGTCFLLGEDDLLSVAGCVEGDTVIKVAPKGDWDGEGISEGVELLLCDGRPSRKLIRLCEEKGVVRLVTTKPLRCCKETTDRWGSFHIDIPHHEVGGVTTTIVRLFFHWKLDSFFPKGPMPTTEDLEDTARRDI